MYFDDRLATVLRQSPSGDGMARIQFRQLVDILGRAPDVEEPGPTVEAGFARLKALTEELPPLERARLLRQPLQPLTNSRLLAWLVEAEPEVACAAIKVARLHEEAWLALVPRLPVRARGILRHRNDLPGAVNALLDRLGVRDRVLPPGEVPYPVATALDPDPEQAIPDEASTRFQAPTGDLTVDQDMSRDVLELLDLATSPAQPTSLSEWAKARAAQQHRDAQARTAAEAGSGAGSPGEAGIGAIVRRIEEFRKAREAMTKGDGSLDAPRLPLGDVVPISARLATAIDFTTDAHGRLDWADGPCAPSVIGLNLASAHDPSAGGPDLVPAMRQRLPLRGSRIRISGAPAVTGAWQVDAVPCFEAGSFTGYCGRLRRPAAAAAVPPSRSATNNAEAERMREVLHELRTPANAIQVAAEIIQQQLYGPAPHEYRALAAAIAGDCAHILAGFEELDRLVKLETGALPLEPGEADLARVVAQTILRLRAWTEPRGSGFSLACDPSAANLPVAIARAEVERLVWRVLAALAGSTAPGEKLALSWSPRRTASGTVIDLSVLLPAVLAEREPAALFDAVAGERAQSLAAGMFGIGFSLRLASAEAAAAGGGLRRVNDSLQLSLPALETASHTSTSATFSS